MLEDLMKEVRDQQKKTEVNDDWWEKDFTPQDVLPIQVEDPELDLSLDKCLEEARRELAPFDLSEKDWTAIREFLTFHMECRLRWRDKQEKDQTNCNMMILSIDDCRVDALAEALRKLLRWPAGLVLNKTERELVGATEEALAKRVGQAEALDNILKTGRRMIVVRDCREIPRINLDGSVAERERERKHLEAYRCLWEMIRKRNAEGGHPLVLVGCSEEVYRKDLRPNGAVAFRLCSHHVHIRPWTEEEMLNACLQAMKESEFELDETFEPAFRNYFHAVFRDMELRGDALVKEQLRRIYNRFYCKPRDDYRLTADCVPAYDAQLMSVEGVLGKLDSMVGLEEVKEEFRNIYTMHMAGLSDAVKVRYHMAFTGRPGTGKTTVARMAADLFYRMNVIKTNKLVVVKPSDLASEWVGGTSKKAMDYITRAYNGVLFIDEAYGLATMDRGHELLNILIQEMENNADKLVVIFAGYVDEMRKLMKTNPGLSSRIGKQIHFNDYSLEELVQIFLSKCGESGFTLHESARDELENCISAMMTREFFGNARDVDTMLQDLKEIWSEEYYELAKKHGKENVKLERVFLPKHFVEIMPPKKEISINDLVGLNTLKKKLEEFKDQAMYQKFLREKGFPAFSNFSMHMIFTGNPGTGKTTVAKLIADDLYSIGMLKTNNLIVAERKDLVGTYGNTAEKTNDVIRRAVGGVLFVDEAYSLADNGRGGLGNEAIEVFLTAMEEHKEDTVFIFAGYVDEMQEFLAMNPGIQSRIGYTFHFEDYTAAELTQMYGDKLRKSGFTVSAGALKRAKEIMVYFEGTKNFGNGRFVDHVIQQTIAKRAGRSFTKEYRDIAARDVPDIKTLIETAANSMQLYDPAQITPEEQRRTAMHELGHAVVMVASDPDNVPESISINSHAGSLGRVKIAGAHGNQTEQELINLMAILLGGKNAEKAFFGSHSTGCVNDYNRAKRIAKNMVENYGMTTYGATERMIMQQADKLSCEIVVQHQEAMEKMVEILLERKEISGKEFVEILKNNL